MNSLLDPMALDVSVPSRAPIDKSEVFIGLWMQRELRRVMQTNMPFVQVVHKEDAQCAIRIHNLTSAQGEKIWPHLEQIGVGRGSATTETILV
ncbi:hypothetical protein COU78_02110 [Candidatus Peregrinibacteria bacterium CG10_big_fil_rev_8_21_14_0_10_49_24]|nr:MAG: hypothetical protein COV83_03710 [Candidatus Peregrinibacteria bacterium CG11_big_fil_rev_8_21_14_0_20_49_14]PIR51272.1 MAG: hypothetical protein COU78_02110 [Candidatus Peregrinibacteria bacterium CG10_big_fil_rev_8_21_14_0_10_49_24]PJA68080.1 MAG: hypothetical protein CO157_00875 [Candidatus Peregrinibacteria bacterium CG_4_9_14_3_um_filter_49_12]